MISVNRISDTQSGFRKECSTIDTIKEVVDLGEMVKVHSRKKGFCVDVYKRQVPGRPHCSGVLPFITLAVVHYLGHHQ